jgi:ABC-2 type transport system ATP-binding protein
MQLLEEVDLVDKAKAQARELSGGQRQRLSIAVGLVNDPKVLFLDEPTTGLDPQARRHLWDLVRQVKAKGKTVIITTHYMDEAEILCDRVAIMDGGKIIAMSTPKDLIQKLLQTGFSKPILQEQADLEDVFLHMTGHQLRD